EQQKRHFHEEGYLVLPRFWSREQTCQEMRSKMKDIIQEMDLDEARTVFTTYEEKHTGDDYFLGSSDKIRFFWEERAFDEQGSFKQDRMLCINKVGHAIHDLDPIFRKHSYEPRVGKLCRELGLSQPLAVQSMYIFKQPRIGGEVTPHQDGSFLYTEPQSVIGLWWALEDCRLGNGCLWAVPGSHKTGVHRRFKRSDRGGCEFDPVEAENYDISGAISLEVDAGALVVLHHSLVHYSEQNTSEKSRHAYSIHVVEGASGVHYPADNWLQRPEESPFQQLP
ncbi:unnamed protein product, partial [Discosporangium mesarthrocarpum]